jgi:hypothetical protein
MEAYNKLLIIVPLKLPLSQNKEKCHFILFFFYKIREQEGGQYCPLAGLVPVGGWRW